MSYSRSEGTRGWVLVAGALAAASYVMPMQPEYQIPLLALGVVLGLGFHEPIPRFLWIASSGLACLAVLGGLLSPAITLSALAAIALGAAGRPELGAALLLLHTSPIGTIQEIFADWLHVRGLETAAPGLIAIALLLVVRPRHFVVALSASLSCLFFAWLGRRFGISPLPSMALAGFPAACLGAWLSAETLDRKHLKYARCGLVLLVAAALSSWIASPPTAPTGLYVMLPTNKDSPESAYFDSYLEALRFGGIQANLASRLEEIPKGAMLLLPWLTEPLFAEEESTGQQQLWQLAQERGWTVLMAGEHTNLGKVADRIEEISSQRGILRHDLTVPVGNSDFTGPVRVADLRALAQDTVLNRGASVRAMSMRDKVLISVDGWWAEPDIGEWLWVGDYIWRPGERAGRISLAVSRRDGNANWIVLGDNSPLLNLQLIADPRAAHRILEISTLWPALLADVAIIVLVILLQISLKAAASAACVLAALGSLATASARFPSGPWRGSFVGESGFDTRNFNYHLARHPQLLNDSGLTRLRGPQSGDLNLSSEVGLVFLIVDSNASIGGVRLDRCRRLGALQTKEGPYLMDAQACRIQGHSRVLIGNKDAAAAFVLDEGNGEKIVILDTAFLARNAPDINAVWLERVLTVE